MSYTFPLEELRSLLEKAGVTDADLKQFGEKNHKYQWNPPAYLKEIEAFEQETGISLPDSYRNFLLQAENGGAVWESLPGNIQNIEPFWTLCYADDPLSWGDEEQTRSTYEHMFNYYKD